MHSDDLAGGLWVEQDGQVNPVDLCMAYARGAKALGVEIREHSRVADIQTRDGRATAVVLADGSRIDCDKLVICAGAWSRQLAAMAGVAIPLAACEHMYLVTDVIEGLPDPCPIIRDLDSGIYLKGDSGKLLLGAFEANPKPWSPRQQDAGFLMFDEDWEHAQPMLEAGMRRAPVVADHGVTHFMNGPESFTPDTRQLMGKAPACGNLFVAAGFNSIGIMSSAGVGKVMAEWVQQDQAPCDLWEVDIARCDPLQCGDDFLLQAEFPRPYTTSLRCTGPSSSFAAGVICGARPGTIYWRKRARCSARPLAGSDRSGLRETVVKRSSNTVTRLNAGGLPHGREALHCQRPGKPVRIKPFRQI